MARQAGNGLCLRGSYRVWSPPVFKEAHPFCTTAPVLMWILFQCYSCITTLLKIEYLHLLELGTFYNFMSELYSWLNHYSLGVVIHVF